MTNYPVHTGQSFSWTPVVTDADGDPVTLHADPQTANGGTVTIVGGTVTYTAPNAWTGFDPFPIWADDGQGNTAYEQLNPVSVNNAPVVPYSYDVYAHVGSTVNVQVAFTHYGMVDDDGDPVSVIGIDSDSGTGTVSSIAPDILTLTPNPGVTGDATFTFTVGDGHGGTGTGIVYVHYLNSPPNANTLALSAHAGSTVVVAPSLLGDDPDGDPLTVTNVGTTFHGTAGYDPQLGISYMPDYGFTGTESFPFTLDDGLGGTATGLITITYSNAAPDAQDFAFDTERDTPVSGNLLDGATDADGDFLTVQIAPGPYQGTFTLLADGTFTYTPAAGGLGDEVAAFTVSDGVGGTTVKSLRITVFNPAADAPVAGWYDADEDATQAVDTADLEAAFPDLIPGTLTVSVYDPPAVGTVAMVSGVPVFTPPPDFVGQVVFTVRITGYSAAADAVVSRYGLVVVNVARVNDAPTAANDTVATHPGLPVDFYPTANDADIDGDLLTITGFTQPQYGTVTNNGMSLRYTPAANASLFGSDGFTYTIEDGHGGTATATVSVTAEMWDKGGLFVWADTNGNGLFNRHEPGVPGVTVKLYDLSGLSPGQEPGGPGESGLVQTTQTDANGEYGITAAVWNPDHTYRFRLVNPDPSRFAFVSQNTQSLYGSMADAGGWLPQFQELPYAHRVLVGTGIKGTEREVIITDADGNVVLLDGRHVDFNDRTTEVPDINGVKRKGLKVGKWENAFIRTRLGNNGIEVVKPDGANLDFIDKDPDRFNVKVFDLSLWYKEGPEYRRWILVDVSTVHLSLPAYNDGATLIPLARDLKRPGWFCSDSQLLVSNTVDDIEQAAFGNRMGPDDKKPAPSGIGEPQAGTQTPPNEYDKHSFRFPSSDRTHLVALDGTLKAEYETNDGAPGNSVVVKAKAPVPVDKVVKLHVNILRITTGGDAVLTADAMMGYIAKANEILAQIGFRAVVVLNSPIRIVNPPVNVKLDDGVGLDSFVTDLVTDKIIMTAEEKALLNDDLKTPANDDIEIYIVNNFSAPRHGEAFTSSAVPHQKYEDIVILGTMVYTTLAHEMIHILTDDANHPDGEVGTTRVNLMAHPYSVAGKITDSRRINKDQAAAARVKRPNLW